MYLLTPRPKRNLTHNYMVAWKGILWCELTYATIPMKISLLLYMVNIKIDLRPGLDLILLRYQRWEREVPVILSS